VGRDAGVRVDKLQDVEIEWKAIKGSHGRVHPCIIARLVLGERMGMGRPAIYMYDQGMHTTLFYGDPILWTSAETTHSIKRKWIRFDHSLVS
jgi:hypothetical protein